MWFQDGWKPYVGWKSPQILLVLYYYYSQYNILNTLIRYIIVIILLFLLHIYISTLFIP